MITVRQRAVVDVVRHRSCRHHVTTRQQSFWGILFSQSLVTCRSRPTAHALLESGWQKCDHTLPLYYHIKSRAPPLSNMRVTKPILLKNLISKIHPQLPLNARESDQLLNVLKTSFRKQLDVVHPTEEQRAVKANSSVTSKACSSHLSTTRHLDDILSNPLFSIRPKGTFGSSVTSSNVRAAVRDRMTLEELTTEFKDRLASGSVTQGLAAKYLKDVFRTALLLNPQDIKKSIATVGSGRLVLKWLQSTGLSYSPQVIQDMQFISSLTAHLVLEDRHIELKEWLLPSLSIPEEMERSWKRHVIMTYVNTSIAQKDHPDIVVDRYCDLLSSFQKSFSTSPRNKISLFSSAGHRLSFYLTSTDRNVSARAYDRFRNAQLPHVGQQSILKALLPLHAPGAADVSIAMKHLRNYASGKWQLPETGPDHNGVKLRRSLSLMCLDTANILIDKKQYKDASWVISYARHEFAAELGIQVGESSAVSYVSSSPSKVLQRQRDTSSTLAFG